ncbi:unnamed protein product, partial [Nesidiocoris tenuis]
MTVDFRDYFWGEKNNGFDVLYQNMKHGLVASKELAEFLRERSNIEENNWKLVSKLAKQASSGCSQGTFAPLWVLLRTTAEKLATLHLQMVQKVGDLVKEVSKYAEELHRKHKSVKEEEGGTLEVVQAIQSTSITLQKARDSYQQKGFELYKLKKENASPRELEKAEQKLKKAQDEYKTLIEKYGLIKEDFEKKMSLACKRFQEVEELHLKQMKDFLTTYAELVESNHDLVGQKYSALRLTSCHRVSRPSFSSSKEGSSATTSGPPSIKWPGDRYWDGNIPLETAPQGFSSETICLHLDWEVTSWILATLRRTSLAGRNDEREKKIRVEIKPLSNGSGPMSASVDELRATVENLSLSPIGAIP